MRLIRKTFEKMVFKALKKVNKGKLILVNYDGITHEFKGSQPGVTAQMQVMHPSFYKNLVIKGDIGFGEDYIVGKWDSNDIESLLNFALENLDEIEGLTSGVFLKRLTYVIGQLFRENTKKGSKRNIRAHYDVGNDFYQNWLDKTMTYSSGIFEGNKDKPLEQAQKDKYGRILGKFNNAATPSILEIGCGWGGFAEAAAASNCKVKSITISQAQYNFAKERLSKQIETEQVDLQIEDYRDVQGSYDYIVSIEMFEAVGKRYWPSYFSKIKQSLKNDGKAVIQTITIDDEAFAAYCKGTDFIRKHTFPGGMLASVSALKKEIEKANLKCKEIYSFGKDYAITLQKWLNNLDASKEAILQQGFSENFIRSWRFYLAYCIAGFTMGRTDVVQLELVHK